MFPFLILSPLLKIFSAGGPKQSANPHAKLSSLFQQSLFPRCSGPPRQYRCKWKPCPTRWKHVAVPPFFLSLNASFFPLGLGGSRKLHGPLFPVFFAGRAMMAGKYEKPGPFFSPFLCLRLKKTTSISPLFFTGKKKVLRQQVGPASFFFFFFPPHSATLTRDEKKQPPPRLSPRFHLVS